MKNLKFTNDQIPSIVAGKQTITWRLDDEKQLSVGDEIALIDSQTDECFGYALINEITLKRIRDLNENDKNGHKVYASDEEMLQEFRKFYGRQVGDDTVIKVVKYTYTHSTHDVNDVTTTTSLTEIKLFCDGGSRGNPGPSATGYVIVDMEDNVVKKDGKYLGITTNNQAEYQAVLQGLTESKLLGVRTVHVFLDSLLVVNQMNGIFKIKNRELWPIHQAVKDMITRFEAVTFVHIPREMNKSADAQVNQILDSINKSGIGSELL